MSYQKLYYSLTWIYVYPLEKKNLNHHSPLHLYPYHHAPDVFTSKNKQVILEEYQPHKSILTESVKVKFAIKPAKTDSLSPTVVT